MSKRAVDLSLEDLAAMGGKAALQAVAEARTHGLVTTGTVDFFDSDQPSSSLAQLHPPGTVTLLAPEEEGDSVVDRPVAKPHRRTEID